MTKILKIIFSFILIVAITSAQTEEKAQAEQKDAVQNKKMEPKEAVVEERNGEVAIIPGDKTIDPGLKIGDIAPSWALMVGPGQFEFLKNWTEVKGKRLRKPMSQPDRYVVVMSFFATWCKPCMKELPHLQNIYDKYKAETVSYTHLTLPTKA